MSFAFAHLLHQSTGRGSVADAIALCVAVHEPDHDAVVIEQRGDLHNSGIVERPF